jgi:hypothetical protein
MGFTPFGLLRAGHPHSETVGETKTGAVTSCWRVGVFDFNCGISTWDEMTRLRIQERRR